MPSARQPLTIRCIEEGSIPEPNTGCWLWLGEVNCGYGRLKRQGRSIKAHHASFILYKGPIPAKKFVLHSCNTKICVNPAHLRPGTAYDNAQDAIKAGVLSGPRPYLRSLSQKQIEEVRERYGRKKRHCKGEPTFESLALEYGVSVKVIWRVVNNAFAR